jgi:uncharacterized coiled-coil DUF342 family protein
LQQGIFLAEQKKEKKESPLHQLPAGILAIAEIPSETPVILLQAASTHETQQKAPDSRPRTQKEQALDELIVRRQSIIEKLKAKNPAVNEARKKVAASIPSVRGKSAGPAGGLFRELERLEFEISTSAYTPKKEKELLKHLRVVKAEVSKHKELNEARKKLDSERSSLNSIISEIKALEHELFEVRKACDDAYSAVLAERKASFESRQKHREEKQHKKFEEHEHRVRAERKREYDDDVGKYLKDYDDTVSMEEICIFEKKGKKKEE